MNDEIDQMLIHIRLLVKYTKFRKSLPIAHSCIFCTFSSSVGERYTFNCSMICGKYGTISSRAAFAVDNTEGKIGLGVYLISS